MLVFLDDDKKVIEARFELNSSLDSIKFESGLKNLNGIFKINISEGSGSMIMKLKSDKGEMQFKRINGEIRL
ncbi:hypothetical protein B7P33_06695 [Sediminicola luteus]|uniref:Uncharacterized protein n=1 Tax=Sediminicola luteus TaxID=319238 RepID=A0A2A4GA47_9FLAO|nr:hypothetical protein B7P33_06695 [Sediminicola luteus]